MRREKEERNRRLKKEYKERVGEAKEKTFNCEAPFEITRVRSIKPTQHDTRYNVLFEEDVV